MIRAASLTVLSFTAFVALGAACATAPSGDDLTEISPQQPEPEEPGTTLPAPSQKPSSADDAGAGDAGSKDSGSDTPKKDASPPSPPPPPPPTGGDCDPNNPAYAATLLAMQLIGDPIPACPCAAGQCCVVSDLVGVKLPLGCVAE